jgi:hypothetical protein
LRRFQTKSFLIGRELPGRTTPFGSQRQCACKRIGIEAKSNPLVDTVVGTGKQGLKVATDLVPDAVPRPIARGGVIAVTGLIAVSVVKSILSTALSLVVVGGLAYAAFVYAKNNDSSGSSGGGGKDDPLDEAKRIMDKYK